jgi:centractin
MSTSPFNRLIIFFRDVTDHLQLLLRKAGYHLHTTAEKEVVRTIKEKCCYVATNPAKEEKDLAGRYEEFRLPDGSIVQVRRLSPSLPMRGSDSVR